VEPHEGQREFLLHPAKIKVLACGRRWGKTDACAAQIVAAMHELSPSRHLILAPTLDQAKLLFERTLELLRALEVPDIKVRSTPYPRLTAGGHTVVARSGHLGRSLRGNEATHIVIDEAAFVPEQLVTEVAMPMLATSDGLLTLISTPHGLNHFWRFFDMGRRGEHGIWSRTAPSSESPYVSPRFLEIQRQLISERAYRVEYEACFTESVGRVFRNEAVQRCLVPRLPTTAQPYYVGVDWARYTDYTAVVVLAGHAEEAQLVHVERFNGMTWSEQIARVAQIIESFGASTALCDGTGVGDALNEPLQDRLPSASVRGLVFSRQSKQEIIDHLAMIIDRGALTMEPHPELLRELEHFEAKPSGSGTRLAASSGYHDDLVIALALAASLLPKRYRPLIQAAGARRFSATHTR
jgi:phage FluMu gp28-like protein